MSVLERITVRIQEARRKLMCALPNFLEDCGERAKDIPKENYDMIRTTFANLPYIEGAWMTKHDRKYYLQYACPGAEINVYADGVYIGDSPLGPFVPAEVIHFLINRVDFARSGTWFNDEG